MSTQVTAPAEPVVGLPNSAGGAATVPSLVDQWAANNNISDTENLTPEQLNSLIEFLENQKNKPGAPKAQIEATLATLRGLQEDAAPSPENTSLGNELAEKRAMLGFGNFCKTKRWRCQQMCYPH
ncbi:MAG: hypothetical protein HC848_05340 [Limnobacter sp.]|nr:hypothetical protein [Limnobacter sp.]